MRTEQEQRQEDLDDLTTLIAHHDLTKSEREAFEDMHRRISGDLPAFKTLHPNARKWVKEATKKYLLDKSPAERNKNVPRGKEVQVPSVLGNLPKSPPRRK